MEVSVPKHGHVFQEMRFCNWKYLKMYYNYFSKNYMCKVAYERWVNVPYSPALFGT